MRKGLRQGWSSSEIKKLASVASEAEGGPGMAVVVVLVVGEVGNGRAGPLMLQKRGSRLRPTHLGRPCCPIFVVLFSTFWDNWSRCRGVYGVLMQFERVHLEVFSTSMTIWSRSKFFSAARTASLFTFMNSPNKAHVLCPKLLFWHF